VAEATDFKLRLVKAAINGIRSAGARLAGKAGVASSQKNQGKGEKKIVVHRNVGILEAWEGTQRKYAFDCVTGDRNHPTPKGKFKIFRKHEVYRSKTYDTQMDYAMFFDGGRAIHQYHGPLSHELVPLGIIKLLRETVSDYFGSHGCVRLSEKDAKALFNWAPMWTPVVVQ
jgi:hypothetical protein